MAGHSHRHVLWWSLALGGDLGGNLTAVGSSANIVMLGIALRSGNPISFWEFTRKGMVITTISTRALRALLVAALLRTRLSGQRFSSATHSM
jgi:Na+/H+ antiporter NhaD/arsenite permease-like protein